MQPITVTTPAYPSTYDISFHDDFSALHKALKQQIGDRSFVVVTDQNVKAISPFFQPPSSSPQQGEGLIVLKPGENEKHWDSIDTILNACFEAGLDRSSVVVAVGGGVVGDMAGFAASVFMRGIPFIQVPTTLLAMVDASIGGKTGIDCQYGKNLIGAIQQPEAVMVCSQFLETLPDLEIKNGMAEMVKHGVVASEKHFEDIENLAAEDWATVRAKVFELAPASMNLKKAVVEADEKEAGKRKFLNFGHTFGHAIELCSNFEVPHGRAVAIGMIMASQYALEEGWCDEALVDRLENLFHQLEVDLTCEIPEAKIWQAMGRDKKRAGNELTLILPRKIGEVDYYVVEL